MFYTVLLLFSLVIFTFTGCTGKETLTEGDLFTNKEVNIDLKKEGIKFYNNENDLQVLENTINEQLNTYKFDSMEDYYQLKINIQSYVDSGIKLNKNLDNVFKMDNLLTNSRIYNLDQDEDGIKDIYEVFIYDTSPFRKISDERTNKDDGTKQKEIYIYQVGSNTTTSVLFSDIIKDNVTNGYITYNNGIVFDLFLKANELQSLGIKLYPAESDNEYHSAFEIIGLYTPSIRGTATFYHSDYISLDTNYITYKDKKDTYLERSNNFTRTVDKLYTDCIYRLYK